MERHLALSGKILEIETAFVQRRSDSHDRSGNSNGQYECQYGYAPQNQEVYQIRYLLPILWHFDFVKMYYAQTLTLRFVYLFRALKLWIVV